jgi:hypothetical protein
MDITAFSVWKFRYVEGFLQDMHSFDVYTTKYLDHKTSAVTWIRYDIAKEVATIERDGLSLPCKFSELEKTLKDLGMYRERPENDRHHLAGPQKED